MKQARIADAEVAKRRGTCISLIASLELVEIDAVVLDRVAQPMPAELGTLDAIHLATSRLWKDMTHVDLVTATHDGGLALGARVWPYGGKGRRRVWTRSCPPRWSATGQSKSRSISFCD